MGMLNAALSMDDIRTHCMMDTIGKKLLEDASDRLALSARAMTRILKVSRTIADMDASANITSRHLEEALTYRAFDRSL